LTYVVNESCIRCKIMDCVDVCPVWLSLNAEYPKIWPITVKKAPPPDSKEWEGKPDKLQYFSPNPGAGD
jgi:ferredoxin